MADLGAKRPGGATGIGSAIGTGWGSTLDLNRRTAPRDPAQIAEQFESVLVQQMLQSMRSASGDSELFNGPGSELARNLLDETLSASVARAGGLGLAKSLLRSFGDASPTYEDAKGIARGAEAVMGASSSPEDVPKTSVPRAIEGPEQHLPTARSVGKDGKAP